MDAPADSAPTATEPPQGFRYFDLIIGVFVTALITSNIVSAKVAILGGFKMGCGIFVFPISYIFGDVLTEVYGYARSRRVIWIGFLSAAMASLVFWLAVVMPPAPDWHGQSAFEQVLGQLPRVVAASLVAYVIGEFANSFVLARMKVWTKGRHLWARTIGSTLVGQAVDSVVFYPLAFLTIAALPASIRGDWTWSLVGSVALHNYLVKVAVETLFTPITYLIVNHVKRTERFDHFDVGTDFNPLKLKV